MQFHPDGRTGDFDSRMRPLFRPLARFLLQSILQMRPAVRAQVVLSYVT